MVFCLITCLAACTSGQPSDTTSNAAADVGFSPALRVYHSPYSTVTWATTLRLKAQHHDHVAARLASVRAYDASGYQALSLMDYSGAPLLPYALHKRLWPPEDFGITSDVQIALHSLRLFIPNAEEVGESAYHFTSPFLVSYIQKYEVAVTATAQQENEYSGPQQAIDIIARKGGFPILAHPWNDPRTYSALVGYRGVEIYSAYASVMTRRGYGMFRGSDKNGVMQKFWDKLLAKDQSILGIAVNDHFGPDADPSTVDRDLQDSGKIIVFAPASDLASYRQAFQSGALVAVQDFGAVKDQYPTLRRLEVSDGGILLETDGRVRWVSMGLPIGDGPWLDSHTLPRGSTYVRAEISNTEGSTLFTQAFAIRPVGDTNGDGVVDALDRLLCDAVAERTDKDFDHVAACQF
jgi:hypothetical protein